MRLLLTATAALIAGGTTYFSQPTAANVAMPTTHAVVVCDGADCLADGSCCGSGACDLCGGSCSACVTACDGSDCLSDGSCCARGTCDECGGECVNCDAAAICDGSDCLADGSCCATGACDLCGGECAGCEAEAATLSCESGACCKAK